MSAVVSPGPGHGVVTERRSAYGLDAICAGALKAAGSEEAAQFARRLYERVADRDLLAAPAASRSRSATRS